MKNNLSLFEEKEIRRIWENGRWYFSVVDVVYALTESRNPRDYWYKLKKRTKEEDKVELQAICRQLKLLTSDGKKYQTDCADTEGILRIIQSIPSPKAEPFKRWLARVGRERIDEINNPELAIVRMRETYKKKGYSVAWINMRERGIIIRNNLTDEWKNRGVEKRRDYAILTNEIYSTGFGISAKEYRKIKNIDDHKNLRDSMTNLELALTNLGETTAVELHKKNDSLGVVELKEDVGDAGEVISIAKREIEDKLEHPVVSSANYLDLTNNQSLENKK